MTFDASVPNPSQSPGLFPAQGNTNFTRLKTIINADHVFNDSAQVTDGVHKQARLINHAIAVPGDLPAGTNGMVYSWLDANSQSQLRFYNGTNDYQLTPLGAAPTKVTGTSALAAGASTVVYTIPNNSQGTILVTDISPTAGNYEYYLFFKAGAAYVLLRQMEKGNSSAVNRPVVTVGGSDLSIFNVGSVARTLAYFIMVESV